MVRQELLELLEQQVRLEQHLVLELEVLPTMWKQYLHLQQSSYTSCNRQ